MANMLEVQEAGKKVEESGEKLSSTLHQKLGKQADQVRNEVGRVRAAPARRKIIAWSC